jgi:hypothetical protein
VTWEDAVVGKPRGYPRVAHTARRAPAPDGDKSLYETEMLFREEGLSDFVYDEEHDLFRFKDGRFAFSRTQANIALLEERDYGA